MEEDDFGPDLYAAVPEVMMLVQGGNSIIQGAPSSTEDDEDSKIKALVESSALDWQGFDCGRAANGRWGGRGGRMVAGRGSGRGLMESKVPPKGYVCRRCNIPGHFIQHCPTNGNPDYDIIRVKPPTGIPKSMLVANPEGRYVLHNGDGAVVKPDEAAFDKEMEGLLSTRVAVDLPRELHCPICKEVMKYAVLATRCCLRSFCDKCIRDYIISKSMCICGVVGVLADDLIINKSLRETITRFLESGNSSSARSSHQSSTLVQGPQPRSSSHSAASKGESTQPLCAEEVARSMDDVNGGWPIAIPEQPAVEEDCTVKTSDAPKATRESAHLKKPIPQGSPLLDEEQKQPKVITSDEGKKEKKKKKNKPVLPPNDLAFDSSAAYMDWSTQAFATGNYMMPMVPSAYNLYWGGSQPGMDPYISPFACPDPYNMPYSVNVMNSTPFWGMLPPDSCGAQGFMDPVIPYHSRKMPMDHVSDREVRSGAAPIKPKNPCYKEANYRPGHYTSHHDDRQQRDSCHRDREQERDRDYDQERDRGYHQHRGHHRSSKEESSKRRKLRNANGFR
ncbi:E3 ubiquitin ligase PQT3-like-like protein [Drosera capensis]